MSNFAHVVALAAALAAVCTSGCRESNVTRAAHPGNAAAATPTDENEVDAERPRSKEAFHYSPFVVKLDGGRFDTVSFKDVGLDRVSVDADDPLLEVISQSFAKKVAAHDELGYEARVEYDELILEPANHRFCGIDHLYVDVWQASSPNRWGYSLWSGCGELDKFAWEEVEAQSVDHDLAAHVEPLTSSMVASLAEAARSKCFAKSC